MLASGGESGLACCKVGASDRRGLGVCRPRFRVVRVVRDGVRGGEDMSVNKAIKLYRSKGLLNDNDHDLPAIDALLDAGYTIKWHGQGPYDTAWCTVIELERGC